MHKHEITLLNRADYARLMANAKGSKKIWVWLTCQTGCDTRGEKLAMYTRWAMKYVAFMALAILLALVIACGKAYAYTAPNIHPWDNTAYQTTVLKLDYTAHGQMAHTAYQGTGSIMLSDGSSQDLKEFYKPNHPDVEILLSTKLKAGEWKEHRLYRVNLLWGGSTGQESKKLYVQPSVKLGVHALLQTSESSILTFSALTTIGGALKERACTADYGVAGTHEVKCSMAGSAMSPAETLKYLTHRTPYNATIFKLEWQWFFD